MTARRKASAPVPTEGELAALPFAPDGLCVRTTNAQGRSRNDFQWPMKVGAMVTCPDWDPTPECGHGLHGLLDGAGDWTLLSSEPRALWWLVEVQRNECVAIDEGKVKFPRCRVKAWGTSAAPLREILAAHAELVRNKVAAAVASATEATATLDGQHASAAGDRGHASAAGEAGHASAAGNRGHASAAGAQGIAAAFGFQGRAKANADGWIVLAHWTDWNGVITLVRAAKVGGPEGILPNTWYCLDANGAFVATEASINV